MSAWSGLGIGLGWYTGIEGRTLSSDLDFLKAHGVNKVRFVANIPDANFVSLARASALVAKGKGFHVLYGCSYSPTVLTTTNFPTYSTAVVTEATWAEANGMDWFCIGNEEELRIDSDTIPDPFSLYNTHLKGLATSVRAVYNGTIVCSISQGAEPWVENITPGNIDKIGFNIYGDTVNGTRSTFQSRIVNFKAYENWGDRLFISEWNTTYDSTVWTAQSANAEKMTVEIANRLEIIKNAGIDTAYFFTWRYSNTLAYFSMLKTDGSIGLWSQPLLTNNGRRFLTQ